MNSSICTWFSALPPDVADGVVLPAGMPFVSAEMTAAALADLGAPEDYARVRCNLKRSTLRIGKGAARAA